MLYMIIISATEQLLNYLFLQLFIIKVSTLKGMLEVMYTASVFSISGLDFSQKNVF